MTRRSTAFRRRFCGAIAALLIGSMAAPARADLIITVLDSAAQPGDTGRTFDVTLTNTGLAGVDVGSFSIELSVPGASGIHFTDATRATALTYIFAASPGPGALNSNLLNPFPNQDFVASDSFFAKPGFATIGAGDTLGLEHVVFSVDPTTPVGPVTVTVEPTGTLLSDVTGTTIPSTLVNGTITVGLRSVPEPSALLLVGLGGGLMFLRRRRRPIAA